MALPPNLRKKYLDRFDTLIQEGERLYQIIKGIDYPVVMTTSTRIRPTSIQEAEAEDRLKVWNVNYESLLDQIIPKGSIHRRKVEDEENFYSNKISLNTRLSRLKALKDDFEQNFLGDLTLQIESEIAADYMGQAEQLLAEGQSGQFDHIPATVLAGAVLEKALRTLCSKQNPPLAMVDNNGNPLMMNRLIDDLKKAGAFSELKAKQLRAWADIRNKAAHGEFGHFTRNDVEIMIDGIRNFLADYLQ